MITKKTISLNIAEIIPASGNAITYCPFNNNGIDIKAFNDIISQIFEVAKYQNQFDQSIIINEIEKLRSEVTSKQPNKDIIKNTLDWIQKTTSIAGFGITLGQVLAPLLGNYIH